MENNLKCPKCCNELIKKAGQAQGSWSCSKCKAVFFILVIKEPMEMTK